MKNWCTEHQMEMWQCFYEHHKDKTPSVVDDMFKLRMPCGHLCDRPAGRVATVTCDSGETTWRLELENGDYTWNARMIPNG